MADFIKKEQINGSQKVVVGEKYNDLVLRTLGRVYIQTGSKMTLLTDLLKSIDIASSGDTEVFTVNTTDEMYSIKYPGDNKLIFIKSSQNLYVAMNENYYPIIAKNEADVNWENISKKYVSKSGDVMTGSLSAKSFNSEESITIKELEGPPLKVVSKKIVNNLNSEYLSGYTHDDFAKKRENEIISGSWDFKNNVVFSSDTLHTGSLWSKGGFSSGFSGYGWKIDGKTNTLTIDNLIVRKTMNVYELVVNKISATNGSLWVSDSAKVTATELVYKMGDDAEEDPESIDSFLLIDKDELRTDVKFTKANLLLNKNEDHFIYGYYFNGDFHKIILDEDNGKYCPFKVNDIIRCQKFIKNNIKYYDAIVTRVDYTEEGENYNRNFIIIRLSHYYPDTETNILNSPEIGDSIVRIGNIADTDRQGSVYITSSDGGAPFIDVTDGMYRPDFSVNNPVYNSFGEIEYETATKVRLGKLTGINDPLFGVNQPKGMGLFAENVYLKGKFVQVENGESYPMPLYKGEYSNETSYFYYDYVNYGKNSYLCVYDSYKLMTDPIKGIAPDSPLNSDNKYWKLYIAGGEDGKPGSDGPSLMFDGLFDAEKQYYAKHDCRTIVAVEKVGTTDKDYYQTRVFSEINLTSTPTQDADGKIAIPIGSLPWEEGSNYWKSFGGQFSSIATGTLFAENANVANFIFRNQKMESKDTVVIDGVTEPVLSLNGITGEIVANSGKFRGVMEALSGTFGSDSQGQIFEIKGNSIIGTVVDGYDKQERIQITTGALPKLENLLEGTNSSNISLTYSPPPVDWEEYYTPYGGLDLDGIMTQGYRSFKGYAGNVYNYSSNVFFCPDGSYETRLMKINIVRPEDTSIWIYDVTNNKYLDVSWVKTNDISVDLFHAYVNVRRNFPYRIDFRRTAKALASNWFDVNPGSGTAAYSYQKLVDGEYIFDNWDGMMSGFGMKEYYAKKLPIIHTPRIESISIFDPVSKTIIASDGFCSYWGPNTYFYFSKSEGLKQATSPVESSLSETRSVNQEVQENSRALTVQDIIDGHVHVDNNGNIYYV